MGSHAKYLSSDCWQLIFSRLGNADLKSVSLCCKDFLTYSNHAKKSLKVIHPKISMLSRLLNRFSGLKTIDLSNFEGDIVEAICEIKLSGTSLEALDILIGSRESSLRGPIPKYLKPLDEVLGYTFPNLEELTLQFYGSSVYFRIDYLASKLKLLRKIHLYSCNVGDQFIIDLSLNCVLLKDVAIVGCFSVSETGVGHLLRNRPNLEALSFDAFGCWSSSSSIINLENSISHNKALTSLELCSTRNTDKVLKAIAKAKLVGLNNLSLKFCKGLSASGLLLLSNQLTKLSLLRGGITEEDLKVVVSKGNMSNLTHIAIHGWQVKDISTLVLLFTRCPSLVDIGMITVALRGQIKVDNIPLSKNYKITSLDLSSCSGINDEFLKRLGRLFPNLKVLNLSETCFENIHRVIKAILKSCKQITELNLSGHYEANRSFVANEPELVELNLEVLDLSHSTIDNEGLAAIAKKCPRLLSLDLSYCSNISTEGIKQVVQNIRTLASLNLIYWNWDHQLNCSALLEWMLSTGNFASLHKIFLLEIDFTKEQRDEFLHHGCLLSSVE